MQIFSNQVCQTYRYISINIVPSVEKHPKSVSFDVTIRIPPSALFMAFVQACRRWFGLSRRRQEASVTGIFKVTEDHHQIDMKLYIRDYRDDSIGIVFRHLDNDQTPA